MDAPGKLGSSCGKLLCAVMDWRKTNLNGIPETVCNLRNYHDPIRCAWFAFSLELYCQLNIDGTQLCVDDFKPRELPLNEHGKHTYHHPWHNRHFLYGNTQSCKGQASTPCPTAPCNYDNCRKAFHVLYSCVLPAILAFHVLHLQRGTVARMADADNMELHEIANAGGWYRHGSLFKSYPTGVPMRFIRWVCGYPDVKQGDNDHPPSIKRGVLDPPDELWRAVWPFYNDLKVAMDENPEAFDTPDERNTTLVGFLVLMEHAAKYFLQDCAVMHDRMSEHEIFSTPVLASPAFFQFREELMNRMAQHTEEEEKTKAQSVPHCTARIFEYLEKIYQRLTGTMGFEKLTLDDSADDSSSPSRSVPLVFPAVAVAAVPAVVTAGPNHFGSVPPVAPVLLTPTPMEVAQQTKLAPVGVDLTQKDTWPQATPTWATNKAIHTGLKSPMLLIEEYTQGYPQPPALRDLEEKYGPDKQQRNSWRKGSAKNKAWCIRRPVYRMVDMLGPIEAERSLVEMVQEHFTEEVPVGATTSEPGPTVMNKLLQHLRKQRAGAKERSARAEETHKRRRLDKEAAETIDMANGAIEQV